MRRHVLITGILAGALCAGPGNALAAGATRVEEAGTVGLSIGGGYGVVTGNSRYGLDYEGGLALNLALRYVLGPHWSLGLSFQSQSYDSVPEAYAQDFDKVVMTDICGEVYFYRDRNQDASQYMMAGLGLYRPEIHLRGDNIAFPGENLRATVGVGAEVFIRENWGLELGARAVGYFGDGYTAQERVDDTVIKESSSFTVGFQGQVGILYYLLR